MSKSYHISHYQHIYDVEKEHFWFVGRNEMIQRVIRQFVVNPKGKRFLDIGCGTGVMLGILEKMGFVATGLDINAEALSYAKQHTKSTLVRSSIFAYHPRHTYAQIGAFDVMEHIEQDVEFLLSCHALLEKHGLLFLTVPAGMYLWSPVDTLSGHVRRYSKESLYVVLEKVGFRIFSIHYWNALLLPIYILWRMFGRNTKKDAIQQYLKQPNPLINATLLGLLRFESWVGMGSWPVGASLVVVAQKV